MPRKQLAIAVLLAACIVVPVAMAQIEAPDTEAQEPKNELSGLIGRTFISDQGIKSGAPAGSTLRSGNGTTIEINLARRLRTGSLFSLSAEVPFVLNPDEDWAIPSNPFGNYLSFFVTPAARVNAFPGRAVSPWISVGGGFGYFSASELKTSNSTGVFQAGVGLDVRVLGRFSLRGEARDFWSGVPQLKVDTGKSRQHNFFVGAGVVWHF